MLNRLSVLPKLPVMQWFDTQMTQHGSMTHGENAYTAHRLVRFAIVYFREFVGVRDEEKCRRDAKSRAVVAVQSKFDPTFVGLDVVVIQKRVTLVQNEPGKSDAEDGRWTVDYLAKYLEY